MVAGFSDVFFGSMGLVYRVGKTTDSVMTTDIPIPCNQSFPVFIPELHEGVCKTSLDTAVGFLVLLVGWLVGGFVRLRIQDLTLGAQVLDHRPRHVPSPQREQFPGAHNTFSPLLKPLSP